MTAWSWEIQAWTALTQGDVTQVIALANAGLAAAPKSSVAAQLHAQKAKAYARMGDQRKAEVSLDAVRRVLDSCQTPANVRNHFNVDPAKASFYAMEVYRVLGSDGLADAMADSVIETYNGCHGPAVSPMRVAEAQLTKALVIARTGAVVEALSTAEIALGHTRQSVPSLSMVAREVSREVSQTHPSDASAWAHQLQFRGT